jgi:hypothetical protein
MANYGMHFMVEVVYQSGKVQPHFIIGQFSDYSSWVVDANQCYAKLIEEVKSNLPQGVKIKKIHPPSIIKLGES